MQTSLHDRLVTTIPNLRAFALSLTHDPDRADDLVQETLLRALAHLDQFEPRTNMRAWLFTILRNTFRSEWRKRRREVDDPGAVLAGGLGASPEQEERVDFNRLGEALGRLSPSQREALLMIGASGFSYEETAKACNCGVGTLKSRINRARAQLSRILQMDPANDLGPDKIILASMQADRKAHHRIAP